MSTRLTLSMSMVLLAPRTASIMQPTQRLRAWRRTLSRVGARWGQETRAERGLSEVDQVGFFLPVGLQEDAVDVVDVDGLVGAADGFDHAADAKVAGLAQDAVQGWRSVGSGDPRRARAVRSRPGRLLFASGVAGGRG